jgi:HK97 family phage major capsid protein/HK97 family phage prohead protease
MDKSILKASSIITVKSFDPEQGIIRGIATTPKTDRDGDIVIPEGAVFELPLPLLFNHDPNQPIGHVIEATATKAGVEIVAKVAKDATAKIAEIWQMIKSGLVSGFSVGFRALEAEPIETGFKFNKWQWLELSAVTIPANTEAAIQVVKSVSINTEVTPAMTISEQIQQFQAKRAEVLAGMDALITKGTTLSQDEDAQYKAAEAEIAAIDQHLDRLKAAEARQAMAAKPVAGSHITVEDNAPKGTDFVRYTKSLALAKGNPMQAVEIAKAAGYGNRVETVLKAAIAAGSTTDAGLSVLIENQLMTSEFIDLLRPATIVGKLSGVRNVPQNIRIPRATSGTSANWVGEGKAAPITNAAFADLEVGSHKLGAIAVFTEELLRRSEPAAEILVRDDLLAAVVQAVDVAFIDQANAGIAGVKPASIANGATSAVASGTTAAKVRDDVKAAYGAFVVANQPIASGVWIMHPSTALSLSMMVNATTGLREFPGVDFVTGGTFEGLPVVLSTNVPGTPVAGYDLILAVQNEILLAEGGLAIDASREASLEMDTAPVHDSKTPTPASLVSLWQTGAMAIKAIRGITWTRRRPTAVYRISGAKYA